MKVFLVLSNIFGYVLMLSNAVFESPYCWYVGFTGAAIMIFSAMMTLGLGNEQRTS